MRVLLITLLLALIGVAVAARLAGQETFPDALRAALDGAVVVLAVLVGVAIGLRRRETPPEPIAITPDASDSTPPEPVLPESVWLPFARDLLAATATADVRGAVEAQVRAMLNGRRVWVVGRGQSALSGTPEPKAQGAHVLTDQIQEWTTFPLHLEGERLGLLGLESTAGLPQHLRRRVQSLTPLIAQALKTAGAVDGFREASVVDLLTGAATRREGLTRLQAEAKRAQRAGSTMAVLMIDVDHFKAINDRYGHATGDSLLTALGQTMARTLRASDLRARWGGEEFLVVLPDTGLAQAQVVSMHLLNNLSATAVDSAGGPVRSTVSIGVTISRSGETDIDRIVARADVALYQAKHAGRACVRVVLGGFDGEPVGTDTRRTPPRADTVDQLPFPDRRNPNRPDRRAASAGGRRATDRLPNGAAKLNPDYGFPSEHGKKVAG